MPLPKSVCLKFPHTTLQHGAVTRTPHHREDSSRWEWAPSSGSLGPSFSDPPPLPAGLLLHSLSYETGPVLLRWNKELISAKESKLVSDLTKSQASNKHWELPPCLQKKCFFLSSSLRPLGLLNHFRESEPCNRSLLNCARSAHRQEGVPLALGHAVHRSICLVLCMMTSNFERQSESTLCSALLSQLRALWCSIQCEFKVKEKKC